MKKKYDLSLLSSHMKTCVNLLYNSHIHKNKIGELKIHF